jgi:hypothetical protein
MFTSSASASRPAAAPDDRGAPTIKLPDPAEDRAQQPAAGGSDHRSCDDSGTEWVQCEAPGCGKWRRLPLSVVSALVPDDFECFMAHWMEVPSCATPQEPLQVNESEPVVLQAAGDQQSVHSGAAGRDEKTRWVPTPTARPAPKRKRDGGHHALSPPLGSPAVTAGLAPKFTKRPWKEHEDSILRKAIEKHGVPGDLRCGFHKKKKRGTESSDGDDDDGKGGERTTIGPQWTDIAALIPERKAKQCRERWRNHLDPSVSSEPWTEAENEALLQRYETFGSSWAEIATGMPGRPDNGCVWPPSMLSFLFFSFLFFSLFRCWSACAQTSRASPFTGVLVFSTAFRLRSSRRSD